jgi:hypothetical protein
MAKNNPKSFSSQYDSIRALVIPFRELLRMPAEEVLGNSQRAFLYHGQERRADLAILERNPLERRRVVHRPRSCPAWASPELAIARQPAQAEMAVPGAPHAALACGDFELSPGRGICEVTKTDYESFSSGKSRA